MTDPWAGRRVLVTGATGIVGGHLVDALLAAGAQPSVLVRDWDPRSSLIASGAVARTVVVQGALEDYATVERAVAEQEADTVVHLGAQAIVPFAHRSPLLTFEANIRGTYHVLEACRVHEGSVARVVVASSDKAYGDSPFLPYTEDQPTRARHPYDVSKACADLLAASYHHTYGLPVAVARCGNIYGPGDLHWDRIVPGAMRAAVRGERLELRSDGHAKRDYIYVRDAVAAYLALAAALPRQGVSGEAFNFGNEQPLTVLELVRAIGEAAGRPIETTIVNTAQAEVRDQWLSSAKAKKVLGWTPRHGLRDGLRETLAWYRQFLGA